MTRVAVATSSGLAADAAAEISGLGGNAVDCAIAAAFLTMNTQPGVCALAGGAYVTVWRAGAAPLTIDGNVAVPGLAGSDCTVPGTALRLGYGGGVDTIVGAPSVAVPGSLAALETAWKCFGRVPWAALLAPAVRAADAGFPMPAACHYYLRYSGTPIFGRSGDGFAAIHHANGELREAGSTVRVPHLAASLEAIAREGGRIFYEGEIGAAIAGHLQERGGALSREDLRRYRAIERNALCVDVDGWHIATNPPPAIGGAILGAMLLAFSHREFRQWDAAALEYLARVQRNVLAYRRAALDLSDDVPSDAARLLDLARQDALGTEFESASTVHTSAVDDSGLACAVTASTGYGSGEMPEGTGLWLNNCLGELELNRRPPGTLTPGARLPSNMAPTAGRHENQVLAIGSPGADRITTALQQFLVNFIVLGLDLESAIAHPRMHVEMTPAGWNIAHEPGLSFTPPDDAAVTQYPEIGMYFGGVGAALFDGRELRAAADPRREGATFVSA